MFLFYFILLLYFLRKDINKKNNQYKKKIENKPLENEKKLRKKQYTIETVRLQQLSSRYLK